MCDQPHPGVVLDILNKCVAGDCAGANRGMKALYDTGYSSNDIIGTVFRVSMSGSLAAATERTTITMVAAGVVLGVGGGGSWRRFLFEYVVLSR